MIYIYAINFITVLYAVKNNEKVMDIDALGIPVILSLIVI
jgi:hypothetical protein